MLEAIVIVVALVFIGLMYAVLLTPPKRRDGYAKIILKQDPTRDIEMMRD